MLLDPAKGRERPANYVQICENLADSYPQGKPHGVQKDAIQNALDARRGKGAVKVEFNLIENSSGTFLTISDSNTLGLTGPVLSKAQDYEDDLPDEYHWARFESFAFTKPDSDAIGARGQGKFIFLSASKRHTMYYDSLRADGVYRLGATQATETGCPIWPGPEDGPWEDEVAKDKLSELCGLEALSAIGARVIIVEPIDDLVDQLLNGELEFAIQETWFRSIEKRRIEVTLLAKGQKSVVSMPALYPLPGKDVPRSHQTWYLSKDFKDSKIRLSTGEEYRVKRFHAVYFSHKKVPDELQGIAIIHNGMKITSLPMSQFPPQVRERATGYIEFDRELDRELRRGLNQDPNHYDLKWRRRLPQAIKLYVNEQIKKFGREKLGLGIDPRELKRRKRSDAEDWAMRQLQRYASDLDLFGASGGQRRKRPYVEPVSTKPIGISINNFRFPDPDVAPRVNWGDKFTDIGVTVYNRTAQNHRLSITLAILYGDSPVYEILRHKPCELDAGQRSSSGPYEFSVDQAMMTESGEYRLRATLFDANTGDKLDSVARRFWVGKDPPLRRPFDIQHAEGFPDPWERRQWLTEGSINSSPTLLVNTQHPAYRFAEEDERELSEYYLRVMLEGAIQFVLRRPDSDNGQADYHPLRVAEILGSSSPVPREEVPDTAYSEIMNLVSDVRWRLYE